MKNEVTQKDFDMPQLRQMVLDNTERINKNELIISQMRKENLEQSRKAVERDEMLENSRREHDRWSQRMMGRSGTWQPRHARNGWRHECRATAQAT